MDWQTLATVGGQLLCLISSGPNPDRTPTLSFEEFSFFTFLRMISLVSLETLQWVAGTAQIWSLFKWTNRSPMKMSRMRMSSTKMSPIGNTERGNVSMSLNVSTRSGHPVAQRTGLWHFKWPIAKVHEECVEITANCPQIMAHSLKRVWRVGLMSLMSWSYESLAREFVR